METNWKDKARRAILGERTELKTLPGYSITPRKYSVFGDQAIMDATIGLAQKLPGSIIAKITPLYKDGNKPTVDEYKEILTDEELSEMMAILPGFQQMPVDVQKLTLLFGLGEHNMTDEQKWTDAITKEHVEDLLQYADVTEECISIIEEHNRPLQKETSGISEKSQNGTTTESILELKPKT